MKIEENENLEALDKLMDWLLSLQDVVIEDIEQKGKELGVPENYVNLLIIEYLQHIFGKKE